MRERRLEIESAERPPLHASRREAWLLWGVLTPALAAYFAVAKLLLHAGYRTTFDLRARVGVLANLARGEGFLNPERGISLLGEHFEPLLVVFVPFFRWGVGTTALLVAQALAGAVTIALGFLLAHDVLRGLPRAQALGGSLALLALYAAYRPHLSAIAFDFHMTTIATPLVAAALLALRRGADGALWALVAVLLATRENAGLVVVGLALYAGATLGRRRLALALAGVGVGAGALVTAVLMPLFRDGAWGHVERLAPLADPGAKLLYLLQLAALLLFLPLLAPRPLLAALPTTALNLAVDFERQYSGAFHYDDQNSVFWLLAAAHGARRVVPAVAAWGSAWPAPRRAALRRAWRPLAAVALVAAAGAGALTLRSILPGPVERDLTARLQRYLALDEEIPLVVDGTLGAHFAQRPGYRREMALGTPQAPDGTLVLRAGEAVTRRTGRRRLDVGSPRGDPAFEPVEIAPSLEVYRWRQLAAAADAR
ncbi:MAG: DUF2079 domain-containing protein [Thermoanaerobaculia bacterium]|nr:DUF2079 domain-containing protein [Thermoanaerobaculia bacterium]